MYTVFVRWFPHQVGYARNLTEPIRESVSRNLAYPDCELIAFYSCGQL